MMHRCRFLLLSFVLLCLLFPVTVRAGAACFPACTIACCETAGGAAAFAGPLGIAVGVTGCTGVCMVACGSLLWAPPACFGNDTALVVRRDGHIMQDTPIALVKENDQVLTLVNGVPRFTAVVRNVKTNGAVSMQQFQVVRIDSTNATASAAITMPPLTVTTDHVMLETGSGGWNDLTLTQPSDIRVGSILLSEMGLVKVVRIHSAIANEKYTLVTAEGTVLASGVLVTTFCDNAFKTGERLDDVLPLWQQMHQYKANI